MTWPCAGAVPSSTQRRMSRESCPLLALSASLWKVAVMPAIGVALALAVGFRGAELGMLFLFLGSPTAAVAYVMARGAGANQRLAASIIMLSTLLSLVSISVGIMVLTAADLV